MKKPSSVLVIDIGGSHVKLLCTGEAEPLKILSGADLTAKKMVADVKKATSPWKYDAVSIGFPGPVLHNQPVSEPHNLGKGWVGFDFEKAFGCPVKMINDAAMQALGSYEGGRMLFLGLGTGLGSAMIVEGILEPMELAHLPYKKGKTYEDYVGERGLERLGKKKWRKEVADVVTRLKAALVADYVVLGGGNSRLIEKFPEGVKQGNNANAFLGGFRLWNADAQAAAGSGKTVAPKAEPAPKAVKPAKRKPSAKKKPAARKAAAKAPADSAEVVSEA